MNGHFVFFPLFLKIPVTPCQVSLIKGVLSKLPVVSCPAMFGPVNKAWHRLLVTRAVFKVLTTANHVPFHRS